MSRSPIWMPMTLPTEIARGRYELIAREPFGEALEDGVTDNR